MTHQEIAHMVRERDKHRCILCERPSGTVHHVVSVGRRRTWPEVWSEQNMVVLCPQCHIDAPGGRGAHNQKGRMACMEYLTGIYGQTWYQQREPWAQILRRGDDAIG